MLLVSFFSSAILCLVYCRIRASNPIEKLDVKNYVKNDAKNGVKNNVKNAVKNGVKNDVKNWDRFLRHFLRQESVVLTSDIEKVCVHVVNNGTEYLCVVPNLYSY